MLVEWTFGAIVHEPLHRLRSDGEAGIPFPDDLMARWRVGLAVEISPEPCDQHDRAAEGQGRVFGPVRRDAVLAYGIVVQQVDFGFGQHGCGRPFRSIVSEQGREPPGDDGVDGHGALDPFGSGPGDLLDIAAGC